MPFSLSFLFLFSVPFLLYINISSHESQLVTYILYDAVCYCNTLAAALVPDFATSIQKVERRFIQYGLILIIAMFFGCNMRLVLVFKFGFGWEFVVSFDAACDGGNSL
jgi:hypothetical protein